MPQVLFFFFTLAYTPLIQWVFATHGYPMLGFTAALISAGLVAAAGGRLCRDKAGRSLNQVWVNRWQYSGLLLVLCGCIAALSGGVRSPDRWLHLKTGAGIVVAGWTLILLSIFVRWTAKKDEEPPED